MLMQFYRMQQIVLTKSMRDSNGFVLRVVEREDLVLRLLHQDVEPHAEVGAHHVHQPEPRHYLMLVHFHLKHHVQWGFIRTSWGVIFENKIVHRR